MSELEVVKPKKVGGIVEISDEQRVALIQTIRDNREHHIGNIAAARAVGVQGTRGQIHDMIEREGLKDEIMEARGYNVEKVKASVYAVACDPTHKDFQRCAAMVLKAHGGSEWSDRFSHEITGKGGGPIELLARSDLSALSEEQLEGLLRTLEKLIENRQNDIDDDDDGAGALAVLPRA